MAQALPAGRVTAAVGEVTVTSPITAGSPPAGLALTHTGTLVALRQVAVARGKTFEAPVALEALTAARQLLAAGARRAPADALTRLGAGRRPPAPVAGAVSVDGVALAVPGALARVLAQRAPAVGVAGAFTSGRVAAAVRVTLTHLPTVRSPEIRGTAW